MVDTVDTSTTTPNVEPSSKKRGRPKKVLAEGDDGKPHRIYDITDFSLYDADNNIVPARLEMWTHLSGDDCSRKLKLAGEECPNTGKWHGQARISFNCPHRWAYVIKLFGNSHIEITVATDDWSYFHKWESVLLLNVDYRKQGARVVFAEQNIAIAQGATLKECAELPGANYQSVKSADLMMKLYEPERTTAPRELIHVDSASSVPPGVYRVPTSDLRWWDKYDGHKSIFINQAVLNINVPLLSQLTGSAPFTVNRTREARYDTVYVYGLNKDILLFDT